MSTEQVDKKLSSIAKHIAFTSVAFVLVLLGVLNLGAMVMNIARENPIGFILTAGLLLVGLGQLMIKKLRNKLAASADQSSLPH